MSGPLDPDQRIAERNPELPRDNAAKQGRLIEGTPEMARDMQRNRNHEIGPKLSSRRMRSAAGIPNGRASSRMVEKFEAVNDLPRQIAIP